MCTVGYEMKRNDVGGACGTYVYWGGAYRVWWGNVLIPTRRWVNILWMLGKRCWKCVS